MDLRCPWCHADLDPEFVRNLDKLPRPCPACGEPIRESIWQILFTVLLLIPVVAVFLYISKYVYDQGYSLGSIAIVLLGITASIVGQKYLPIVSGPARAARRK